jgi:Osmosensitive K+ channel histidine kinase
LDGSVHMNQAMLEELRLLRERVTQLEQEKKIWQQQKEDYQHQVLQEHTHATQSDEELTRLLERVGSGQALALDAIFNTITDGLVVYDRDGRVIRSNDAFKKMMGIVDSTDIERYTLQERGERVRLRDDQGRPLSPARWPSRRLLDGESIGSGDLVDITITTLDDRELQIDISGAPVRDSAGNIVGAVAVLHDITLRKQIAQRTTDVLQIFLEMTEVLVQGIHQPAMHSIEACSAIHQLLCRLAQLGQSVMDCICLGVTLVDHATALLNPITVAGNITPAMQLWQRALAGQPLSRYFSAEQLASLQEGNPAKIMLDPAVLQFNVAVTTTVEEPLYRSCYLIVPMLLGSDLIGLMSLDYGMQTGHFSTQRLALSAAVAKLITLIVERERLLQERAASQANELALLEANRRMDEFLSLATHELRTPLTTIHGNVQLAKRRVKLLAAALRGQISDEHLEKLAQTEDLLLRAERQVHIQNRLVSDLLDVSRIQANRLELNMSNCDLGAIVRDAIENQRMATEREILFAYDSLSDDVLPPLPIYADTDRIGQVIINFLTNALKYSPEDRPVKVALRVAAGRVTVRVSDEGPGISAHELPRLWERFYRVPGIAVQSGSGVGLGLGLHICRTIVERHNGMVGVESTPGAGSTFWFELPLAKPDAGSRAGQAD